MQYRRARAVLVLLLLALLTPGALAAGDASGGFGHVYPAPDPSDPVDVPAPFPASPAAIAMTRLFPATAEPQPTFAPGNGSAHVYVSARDSTVAPPPNSTLFVCDGAGDEVEIAAAIAAAPGGIVELLDGSFRCSGRITLPAHTTLQGQGSSKTTIEILPKNGGTGYLPIDTGGEYVNIVGFTMRGNAFVMVTRSHVRVRDVLGTSIDLGGTWRPASGNGMFFVWVAPPVTVIDDVEFYQCRAVDCHTHGFNMNQDYRDFVERTISNVRFLDCSAVRCGFGRVGDPGVTDAINQSRSEWITGFDLHEWQDLVNCEVVNCVAENNWESGFHLEPGARYDSNGGNIGPRTVSQNIVFKNCVSSNNGQRNTYAGHFFMSGYYLSRDTHLENCVSFNNRNCGYYVHGGANSSFVGCTDDGSTYGWKVCKASEVITITDCTSRNNLRWAFWLAFSRQIRVEDFRHSGVVGDRGYQSILGWYKDEAPYQLPVTDSSFEITAGGNGMPIINQDGDGNTYTLLRAETGPADPVLAEFTATPTSGDAPLSVRFDDHSTNATRWWWDFGDGTGSHERDPVHVYGAPGNYTVTLMAANDMVYDAETRADGICVRSPVQASFLANRTSGPAPLGVAFTDTSYGSPTSWRWDFGDGTTSTDRHTVHVYESPGTYSVTLTAGKADFEHTTTAIDGIAATAPPPAIGGIPGATSPPTDTDGDGILDDLNGNGRRDFADVVLYFNQMSWLAAYAPVSQIDCNGNGRVDFADVVWLFNRL